MTIIKKKWLLEIILLVVLNQNTWNHTTVCKLFVLDRNTWYRTIVYKTTHKEHLHKKYKCKYTMKVIH